MLLSHQKLVLALGSAGLIPFLASPLLLLAGFEDFGLNILKYYSLAILSFLSGSWWGIALVARNLSARQRSVVLILSNILVIVAVAAAVLFSIVTTLVTLMLAFVCQLIIEGSVPGLERQPQYYRRMRLALSSTAAACQLWVLLMINPG